VLLALLRRRLPLLEHSPNFRNLWASTIFTASEEVLHFTALPLYVLNLTGSGAALAALWAVQTLAALLTGPVAGLLADRFNRRRVWLGASVVIAVAFALYPLAQTIEQLFALVSLYSAAATVARNAYLSMLPDLVEEKTLVDANALISMNFNLTLTVMPLVAGGLIAASGARLVFGLLLLVRLAAIFWVSRIGYAQNVHPAIAHTAPGPRWLADLRAGFKYAREHPEVRALLITTAGSNMGMGGLIVLETLLIKQVLNAGDAGYGLMLSIAGLGAITGSLLIKPSTARWPLTRVFGAAVLLTGLSFFPYASILWYPATLIIAYFQTLTFVMGQVLSDTIVQRTVPERLRGRVFGLVLIVRNAMTLLAVAVFGLLVDGVGVTPLLHAAGVPFALAGVYALWAMRAVRPAAAASGPQVTAE
jgi:MFS family permease